MTKYDDSSNNDGNDDNNDGDEVSDGDNDDDDDNSGETKLWIGDCSVLILLLEAEMRK